MVVASARLLPQSPHTANIERSHAKPRHQTTSPSVLLLFPSCPSMAGAPTSRVHFCSWNPLNYLNTAGTKPHLNPFFLSTPNPFEHHFSQANKLHKIITSAQDGRPSAWVLLTLLVVANRLRPLRRIPQLRAPFASTPALGA